MPLSDIFSIASTILVSIGGGTAIVFAFSNFLGKVWANRLMEKEKNEHTRELEALKSSFLKDSESYKIKLKKSELIFEKQFEAASALVALHRRFLPGIHFPDMDWEDFLDHYVLSSKKIEKDLNEYLSQHGAVLGAEVEKKISECLVIASLNKFEVTKDYMVTSKGKDEAEKIFNLLNDAKKLLIEKVTTQTSI